MPMRFAVIIKAERKARKWSQAALAEKVGVEQPTVQRWEAGTRKPDRDNVLALARAFEVEPHELMDPDELAELGLTARTAEPVPAEIVDMWASFNLSQRQTAVRLLRAITDPEE